MDISIKPKVSLQGKIPRNTRKYIPGKVRIKLQYKITLPFLVLAIIIALGAGYVVTQLIYENINDRFNKQLIEAAKLSTECVVRVETRMLQTVRMLANLDGAAEALSGLDAEKLRTLALGVVIGQKEEEVAFLDATGNLIFSMHHIKGGQIDEYNYSQGGGPVFMQWDFARQVVELKTDALGNKYDGVARTSWGDILYISGPVIDPADNFAGVVLVGKSLDTLTQVLREETLAQISLYDQNGTPLASTLFDPKPLDSTAVNQIIQYKAQSSLKREIGNQQALDVQRDLTMSNLDYTELLAPWEMRAQVDWGVIGIALAKVFLVSSSSVTRMQVMGLVGATVLLVILMGYNLAILITRPLKQLVAASREVSRGNLTVRIDERTNDEVEVLIENFNEMVGNLQKSKEDIIEAYDSTLYGWAKALELRDYVTSGHTQRVTDLTVEMARAMKLPEEKFVHIHRGAMLHDQGKMGVPDAILNKPGKLTQEEWEIMRKHPEFARDFLSSIKYLEPAMPIPQFHHERWDGKGYPYGLNGEEIPIEARIFSVVDVWDALTSERPYKPAFSKEESLKIILEGSGTQFDSRVVDTFIQYIQSKNPEPISL